MNYIKQILLYKEIANLDNIPVNTDRHFHISPDGTTTTSKTFCIKTPGLMLMSSRISNVGDTHDSVSYRFSIANNNVLSNAPTTYCNDSVLARAIYNMYNARHLGILPFANMKIR